MVGIETTNENGERNAQAVPAAESRHHHRVTAEH